MFLRMPRDGSSSPTLIQMSEEQLNRLISREGHGDARETVRVLARENKKARERARKAEDELATLKTGNRIAPEGGVVLTPDQAKQWAAFEKFMGESKSTPEQIIEAAKKIGELQGELATVKRKELYTSVADEMGWNSDALAEVLDAKKLEVQMREITVKDEDDPKKTVKKSVAHVRAAGDEKASWEPLDQYAETHLKTFLPALVATGDDGEETETGGQTRTEQRERTATGAGVRVPTSTKAKTPAPKGRTEDEIRKEHLESGTFNAL